MENQVIQLGQVFDCFACGKSFYSNEMEMTKVNNKYYCKDCADDRIVACGRCGDLFDRENADGWGGSSHYFDGEHYHQDCFYALYFYCERCNEVVCQDDGRYHESSGCSYCQHCWEALDLHNEDNRQGNCVEFSTRRVSLEKVTFKHLRYARCFGIELEINDDDLPYDDIERDTVFGSKYDGSLNCGSEFYTPILQGDIGYNEIKKFCDKVKYAHVGACAGYHLHIDGRRLTWQGIKKLWLLYNIFEGVLYYMLPHSRRNNNYCKPSNMDFGAIASINSRKQLADLWYGQNENDGCSRHDHYNKTRYYGFNIHSYFYQQSIEIRYHSSTTNFEKVINWIKINQSIFDYALNHSINDILALKNFDNCNTNYARIRKMFKKVIRNDSLWKYYKQRFEKFSMNNKEYGLYRQMTREEMNREQEHRTDRLNYTVTYNSNRAEIENVNECSFMQ